MDTLVEKTLQTIRMLCAETIQKANSGHPGLPLGAAPIAYALFHDLMRYDPHHPNWPDRDRFVLSAGHGSSLLYVMLYLYGFEVSIEDLKHFRQLGSRTPGHPERGCLPGVETTTGPLGAGFSNAVGMALAERRLRSMIGSEVCDHFIYVLASDGDVMEGIAHEAASIAGHQKLDHLVVFYDSNRISIEGSTDVTFTDHTARRFESLGWSVTEIPGEDPAVIVDATRRLMAAETQKPKLVICHTTIGRGAFEKEGTASCHGSPLGADVIARMRAAWNYGEPFSVSDEVRDHIRNSLQSRSKAYNQWRQRNDSFFAKNPEKAVLWEKLWSAPTENTVEFPVFTPSVSESTRKSSGRILNAIARCVPQLVGGSADLAPSNNTWLDGYAAMSFEHPDGRNFHFGIREHGMGGVVNGMALHGGVLPYGATFLVFSDYMRPAVRLSALMKLPVWWIFTHDSIHVGEDGPTHQPVEHLDALRLIPDLCVIRPADGNECVAAYRFALSHKGPVAILLTRQNVPQLERSSREPADLEGYIIGPACNPHVQLFASGSEVATALQAAQICSQHNISVEVVSVPMFNPVAFGRAAQLAKSSSARVKIALEAATCRLYAGIGVTHRIGLSTFGESAPEDDVVRHFHLDASQVVEQILTIVHQQ